MLHRKQILFIQIGTETYAVEINQIKRFTAKVEVLDFDVRNETSSILGMICIYDELIPVLDLCKWFKQESIHLCESTIFVVMTFVGKSFAFPINDVIKCCEVQNECFHTVPDVFRKESRKSFREVIDYNGKLYLKISGEAIFKEIQVDVEILGGGERISEA